MEIFPAIDIRNGNVVRLTEGDYNRMTVYGSSPLEMAETFIKKGAKNLHMVDLDGAKDGAPVNFDVIKSVAETGKLFTEVGGGIRDEKRIEDYLSLGVNRVILGTVAVRNFKFVEEAVKKYGDKIAVGVDARDGKVAVSGWLETTEIDSLDFCRKLRDAGVKTVIYTDISKDGTLSGTNLEIYEKLSEKYKVSHISFPDYNCDSSALVKMYLSGEFGENAKDVSPYIASTFYAADRYATYKRFLEKYYN